MMNCRRATRLLSEAQERKLSFKERSALKLHTLMCTGCRNFEKQMHSLRRISRSFARGATDEDSSRHPKKKKTDKS
ncbi:MULTISPECIES: zf-HC2 domain-containing protein [unclassified Microbulbifer]|uniref:zf-HC2 domain-containing protein n=1 Tax=unclassified Microbulbifer TaxID=2619833 RepID=UPI0027E4F10C|nr:MULTISPECIES: zf-HC2 domain-containing protein [unclassified Microbulbifer]